MRKISSLLLVCVFVFGMVMMFSGVSSALTIVGDPYVGDSWHQRFGMGGVDTMELSILGDGSFKNPGSFSDSSWKTLSYSTKHLVLGGNNIMDLIFEIVFEGQIPDECKFNFIGKLGSIFKESLTVCWKKGKGWTTIKPVPDAGIMWLLGPALLGLGLLGRRKSKK